MAGVDSATLSGTTVTVIGGGNTAGVDTAEQEAVFDALRPDVAKENKITDESTVTDDQITKFIQAKNINVKDEDVASGSKSYTWDVKTKVFVEAATPAIPPAPGATADSATGAAPALPASSPPLAKTVVDAEKKAHAETTKFINEHEDFEKAVTEMGTDKEFREKKLHDLATYKTLREREAEFKEKKNAYVKAADAFHGKKGDHTEASFKDVRTARGELVAAERAYRKAAADFQRGVTRKAIAAGRESARLQSGPADVETDPGKVAAQAELEGDLAAYGRYLGTLGDESLGLPGKEGEPRTGGYFAESASFTGDTRSSAGRSRVVVDGQEMEYVPGAESTGTLQTVPTEHEQGIAEAEEFSAKANAYADGIGAVNNMGYAMADTGAMIMSMGGATDAWGGAYGGLMSASGRGGMARALRAIKSTQGFIAFMQIAALEADRHGVRALQGFAKIIDNANAVFAKKGDQLQKIGRRRIQDAADSNKVQTDVMGVNLEIQSNTTVVNVALSGVRETMQGSQAIQNMLKSIQDVDSANVMMNTRFQTA